MQTVLDQSAIDALFSAQGLPPIADEAAAERQPVFDFGCAGQISSEQMRAISVVNDHFARNLMHTLGAWLRTQTKVRLVAGEQLAFGEFLSRIPEPAYVCILRLDPLGAIGVLELDLHLAMTALELLLGGRGSAGEVREVTDIEDAILASVVDVIVRELNASWATVGLSFAFDKRDSEGKVPRLLPGGERTLCVSFEVDFLGVQGTLNFCLPAVVLNTVHRRLGMVQHEPRQRFPGVAVRVAALMGEAPFRLQLRSQTVSLPSREVAALREGSILELPLPVHTPGELRVGDAVLATAVPARRSGQRSALLTAGTRTESTALAVTTTSEPSAA